MAKTLVKTISMHWLRHLEMELPMVALSWLQYSSLLLTKWSVNISTNQEWVRNSELRAQSQAFWFAIWILIMFNNIGWFLCILNFMNYQYRCSFQLSSLPPYHSILVYLKHFTITSYQLAFTTWTFFLNLAQLKCTIS